MTGMKLGVVILGMAALAGISEVQRSVDNIISHDSRALYMMAQYKIAVGDTKSALQLVQRANSSRETRAERTKTTATTLGKSCPYSQRG